MATKYMTRCTVMLNGTMIDGVKDFKVDEETARKEVELMNSTGSVDVTRRYKFSLTYAPPKTGAKTDWLDIEDATVIIELDGGQRISYSGVDALNQGEMTLDGEKEAVTTINFIATSKEID